MCGRYTLIQSGKILEETFKLQPSLFESYNIAPTHYAPIIWQPAQTPAWLSARWGLMPHWVKEPSSFKASLFNARAETLQEKASFKRPFKSQRCLIPASGFYEWKTVGAAKQPYYIHPADQDLMMFAGLYDHWQGDSDELYSYTIITTSPNDLMADIHNRMPVILSEDGCRTWLAQDSSTEELESLLQPYAGELTAYPVARRVGKVSENDADLIQAVEEDSAKKQ